MQMIVVLIHPGLGGLWSKRQHLHAICRYREAVLICRWPNKNHHSAVTCRFLLDADTRMDGAFDMSPEKIAQWILPVRTRPSAQTKAGHHEAITKCCGKLARECRSLASPKDPVLLVSHLAQQF